MTEPVAECEDDDWYDRLLSRIGRSEALDQRVATHEASHAVALRLLDWPVGSVTIDPGETYEGLVSGPTYSVTRSQSDIIDAGTVSNALRPLMPQPGESRDGVSDIFQSALDQCLVMMAGEVGERMLLPDEPQPASSDRRQAAELAGLICKSPQAVERLIALAETMADDLLRPYGHVIIVLSTVLRMARTMTGRQVDEVIATALHSEARALERDRYRRWQRVVENAAAFRRSSDPALKGRTESGPGI